MKDNACTVRKEGMSYQPEPKVGEWIPVTLSENMEKKCNDGNEFPYLGNAARTCHSCQYRGKLVYLANAFPSQKTEAI